MCSFSEDDESGITDTKNDEELSNNGLANTSDSRDETLERETAEDLDEATHNGNIDEDTGTGDQDNIENPLADEIEAEIDAAQDNSGNDTTKAPINKKPVNKKKKGKKHITF